MSPPLKSLPRALPLFLLLSLLCACAARQEGAALRSGAALGLFEGSAAAPLAAELKKRRPFAREDSALPRLSSVALFELALESGSETVINEERRPGEAVWEEDPLTGQVFLVRADETREVPADYDFQKATGNLKVEWRLDKPGAKESVDGGLLFYRAERSYGSYLQNRGRNGRGWNYESVSREILDELVSRAADDLVELAGPLFTVQDLAPASDPLSLEARDLAAGGDWEGAALIWLRLLELNPAYGPALYNLGLRSETLGDLKSAWEYYRLAFIAEQDYQYRTALTRVTQVLRRQNQLPRAGGARTF
ncbi:MAG: hypothetical protein LBR53_01065 [Deltaproteobacteria bacterium]|jgi:tetratricopeptide (TPR) repeat protein|nr:hypothetical protein [Deltaproteobacteria bacterium]